MADDKILKEAKKRLEACWEYDKENREEAIKDLRFLALDQWPQSVRDQRAAEDRPCLTLDHLNQYKNQVVNDIRQAKIALRAVGVDSNSDPKLAELMTGLMRDVQYQSGAQHVYAAAADGQVSCGIGHFRFTTEYCQDSVYDQELKLKDIPYPLSVYWDAASYEKDRSDASYCFVVDFWPEIAFKEKFPKAKMIDVDTPKDWDGASGFYWSTKDGVLVAEYWKKVPSKRRLVAFEDGSTFDLTDVADEDIAMLQIQHGQIKGEREADGSEIVQYLMTGAEILEGPNEWAGRFIPIIPVVGDEVYLETTCVRKSLIRAARDGQQLYNYWRSAAAELIALAPKSKWLVTAKQIAQYKTQWDKSNLSPKPYLMYEPDERVSTSAPSRVAPPEPPAAMWHEAALVNDDLKAATGIYDASLGAKGNETSGVAIARRQQEGDVSNYHFSDNLQRSLEHAGRVMLDLIPRIYDSERVVRLMGDDDMHSYESINSVAMGMDGQPIIVNNLAQSRFDIRVDIGPSYTTQRIEAATSMLDYAKSDPTAMPVMRDIFVRNMDWPGADQLADRLKKTIPPQYLSDKEKENMEPAPPPPPDPQVVAQQQKMQLDAQSAQEKLQIEKAKAAFDMQVKQAELEMERQKFQLEQQARAQQMQMDQQEREIERGHKIQSERESRAMEVDRHNQTIQLEREKNEGANDLERDKLQLPKREEVVSRLAQTMETMQKSTQEAISASSENVSTAVAQSNQQLAGALQGFGKDIAQAIIASKPEPVPPPPPPQPDAQLARAIEAVAAVGDGIGDLGQALLAAAKSTEAAVKAVSKKSEPKQIILERGRNGELTGATVN